jgi:hypothetical protein
MYTGIINRMELPAHIRQRNRLAFDVNFPNRPRRHIFHLRGPHKPHFNPLFLFFLTSTNSLAKSGR